MSKSKLVFIIGGALFLVIGVVSYLSATSENTDSSSENNQRVATDPADIENPGRFVDYSEAVFANATETKKVLFFHSLTCVVCDQIERNMQAGVMPEDVVLFKVQLEQEGDLVDKYDINLQSHFVQVDNSGEEVKDWNWLSKPFADPQDLELEVV